MGKMHGMHGILHQRGGRRISNKQLAGMVFKRAVRGVRRKAVSTGKRFKAAYKAFRQSGGAFDGGNPPSQWGGARTMRVARGQRPSTRSSTRIAARRFAEDEDSGQPVAGPSGVDDATIQAMLTPLEPLTPPQTPPAAPAAPPVRPAGRSREAIRAHLARIRPGAANRRPVALRRDPDAPVMRMLARHKATRRTGATVPHSRVCGWFLHGPYAGQPRMSKKAFLLRQGTMAALTAWKVGRQSLNLRDIGRMRSYPDFPQWKAVKNLPLTDQSGEGRRKRRGQKGGILPLAALAPLAIPAAKALGLGLLGGAGTALGGGLMGKLF